MSLQHRLDPARKLITLRPVGEPDFLSCTEGILKLASDPALKPDHRLLCDLRQFRYSPSTAELLDLGRMLASSGITLRHPLAIVVSTPEHQSMARLMAVVAAAWGGKMAVFTEVEAAEKWLLSTAAGEDDTPSSPEL